MNKEKGFTLAELLSVLAIISLIVFPKVGDITVTDGTDS